MTSRICEWCSGPLNGNQRVACSASHRLLRWQWLHGVSFRADGKVLRPPEGSVLLQGHPGPGRAVQTAEDRSGGSRVSKGGLQVSFWKAVEALKHQPPYVGHDVAVEALASALSDRQRERLEASGAMRPLPGQLDLEGREAA